MAYQIYGCHKRFSGPRLRRFSRSRLVFLCWSANHMNVDTIMETNVTLHKIISCRECVSDARSLIPSIQCTKFHFISSVFLFSVIVVVVAHSRGISVINIFCKKCSTSHDAACHIVPYSMTKSHCDRKIKRNQMRTLIRLTNIVKM